VKARRQVIVRVDPDEHLPKLMQLAHRPARRSGET
jgi:hypothetical protein